MLNWLKFTFGSFTSNNLAKEGAKRSFWNVVFAFFMLLMLLTAFFSCGVNFSFNSHFSKANDFKDFSYQLFANDDVNSRVNIKVIKDEEGNVNNNEIVSYFGNNQANVAVINTFDNLDDKAKYSKNGYDVIIDTRDASKIWVEFEANYYLKDEKISYEEYLKVDNKKDYSGKIEFVKDENGAIKVIDVNSFTEEYILKMVDYINNEYIESATDEKKEQWKNISLLEKNSEDYLNSLYEFYCISYYKITLCPNLEYYYQYNYSAYDEKGNYIYNNFILLTRKWSIISFRNDKEHLMMYYGYYSSFADSFVLFDTHSSSVESVKNNVDAMYISIFNSSSGDRSLNLGINLFRYFPLFIIVLAVLSLFMFCLSKVKKGYPQFTFIGNFKIVSSFLIGASTVSGIIALILAFILETGTALSVGVYCLLGTLSIRTFVYAIIEAVRAKNNVNVEVKKENEEVIDVVDDEDRVDLSKVETGTRVIINEDVDDDDDEQMELM